MKTVLKLCIIAVMLVLGVSSCFKHDDVVSMSYQSNSVYVLQNNNKFIPQVRLFGERLASASVSVEGKTFNFSNLNGFAWELTNRSSRPLPELDSISEGYYTITAKRDDGKIGNLHIGFNAANKKIGDFSSILVDLSTENTKEISITLDSLAENATKYHLMVKEPISEESSSYTMWIPYSVSFEEEALSIKISLKDLPINFVKDATYRFAIGAGYGSVIRIDEDRALEITMK